MISDILLFSVVFEHVLWIHPPKGHFAIPQLLPFLPGIWSPVFYRKFALLIQPMESLMPVKFVFHETREKRFSCFRHATPGKSASNF